MPLFTVLIPTHDHGFTIRYAIKSIQYQSIQDFELFVVGDGQPAETDHLMDELCAKDKRIKFFPNPDKGAGNGELYRHQALESARGKYVCYLGDDDMWMNNHLQVLSDYLRIYDLAHTLHFTCDRQGKFKILIDDLNLDLTRYRLLNLKFSFFGLSCTGHRMDAYRKLPYGWCPKPPDIFSDLHMWRQFLQQDWCKAFTIHAITTLKLPSRQRVDIPDFERRDELEQWWDYLNSTESQTKFNEILKTKYIDGYSQPNWYARVGRCLEKNAEWDLAVEAYFKVLRYYCDETWAWERIIKISTKVSNKEKLENLIKDMLLDNPNKSELKKLHEQTRKNYSKINMKEKVIQKKPTPKRSWLSLSSITGKIKKRIGKLIHDL